MNSDCTFKSIFSSPIGNILIQSNSKYLLRINFIEESINEECFSNEIIEECKLQLEEYFNGKRKVFDVPLKFNGTKFQNDVWKKLEQIKFGHTISYSELSEIMGNKLQIRAIANANSKNPFAIIIPCHRVIGKDGSMTGYAGGLWRKKWLIEFEKTIEYDFYNLELFR